MRSKTRYRYTMQPRWVKQTAKTMIRIAAAGINFGTITTFLYIALIAFAVYAVKHGM